MNKNKKEDKLFECSNISIGYSEVLAKNISFVLNRGKIVFIKGKNGSGKTTLIKTILGKIPSIKGHYKWYLNSNFISYLPQVTNTSFNFSFNIGEILDIYNISKKYREKLPKNLIKKRWIDTSRGEKQKVMLITRLTKFTKILILDEPFNHLDVDSIKSLAQLIQQLVLSDQEALSIILVSHLEINIPRDLLLRVDL